MKLIVHCPLQEGTTKPRRVVTVFLPLPREASAGGSGKEVLGESSLITTQVSGWMTTERRVRPGSAKPEAIVERMEMAAMRVNFIVGRR